MYCGGCFRDNALVAALRKQGHDALMVPLYRPLTLDEPDQSEKIPIFYGGINVYLDQKSSLFRRAPRWLHQLLSARPLLHWASGRAAKTQAAEVGELLLSMLRGEEGQQARELTDLITWLKTQRPPDAICISNALLAGMARRLKAELHAPVVCLLAGEDAFLDSLPEAVRQMAWQTLAERCVDVDLFLPPSRYFGDLMGRRLQLRPNQLALLPNGISLAGYPTPAGAGSATAARAEPGPAPVLGYFARMCREKGLDRLVDAYLLLKKRNELANLRLHIGGGCGPSDEPLVEEQKRKLAAAGVKISNERTQGQKEFVAMFPDGVKVEFYQDKTLTTPIAHHHLHFRTTDPDGLRAWWVKAFGAEVKQEGNRTTTSIPGAMLSFTRVDAAAPPTRGHSLDHTGVNVKNVAEYCDKLAGLGIQCERTGNIAMVTDPAGTRIEINQGLESR